MSMHIKALGCCSRGQNSACAGPRALGGGLVRTFGKERESGYTSRNNSSTRGGQASGLLVLCGVSRPQWRNGRLAQARGHCGLYPGRRQLTGAVNGFESGGVRGMGGAERTCSVLCEDFARQTMPQPRAGLARDRSGCMEGAQGIGAVLFCARRLEGRGGDRAATGGDR